ncbi:MAG: ATP phosphoribosyltransferase regulatory subunit [Phycisphaerales bacterium]
MSGKKTGKPIQAPKGTRDLYPEDALRRRYVQQAWRDASIRCGFDEIAGPTFETSELYAVKSGEGILGELFQAYSGKSPDEVEQVRETGRAPYAMRPEFTPTLARMYAAKAGSLPRPCKWFTAGPYFRAERPQRGRLREFEQWNVDVLGQWSEDGTTIAEDAEILGCAVTLLGDLGLHSNTVRVLMSNRDVIDSLLQRCGVSKENVPEALALLDRRAKMSEPQFVDAASALGLNLEMFDLGTQGPAAHLRGDSQSNASVAVEGQGQLDVFEDHGLNYEWFRWDYSIVRGLAYYTGTVFEVIAEGERAVAGGGRYDNLIELMGGPPTPAVGFAMGDVVLSLLLEDKGLMPEGADLLNAVSRPAASVRPDVFVIGADDEATDPLVRRLAADLRRGVESQRWAESDDRKPWARERYESETGGVSPLHARVSYKSTRNLKKLLADGEKQFARYAAIVHGEHRVQLRDLDARSELTPNDIPGMDAGIAEFSVDPSHAAYVGRAVAALVS